MLNAVGGITVKDPGAVASTLRNAAAPVFMAEHERPAAKPAAAPVQTAPVQAAPAQVEEAVRGAEPEAADTGDAAENKKVPNDIPFTLYGKSYVSNQSEMMFTVFS
ncbi:MAG: hypothetical protein IJ071_04375 [Ruminococcus sp.]|nr:hypothetical protein [Ruminococcus sp.]